MRLKPGVRLGGVKPEVAIGMMCCEAAFAKLKIDFVITSVMDGKHKDGSKHYEGLAFDVRTRHIRPEHWNAVVNTIRDEIGDGFDVVLEGDHIHIEYDPK